MENNNWQNRRHHLRDKRFNNKKIQRPYIGRHREIPYDKHKRQYTRNPRYLFDSHVQSPESSTSSNATIRDLSLIPISHEEAKALKLINAIKSQTGIYGELVFLQTEKDNAAVILQNALRTIKNGILSVMPGKQPQNYELKINGELIATGEFTNKQAAKNGLYELALDKLKKTCFLIIKKRNYENISTEDLNKPHSKLTAPNTLEGSKAHLMMLKMGWGGKGLGINEQGAEKTVAETMVQNITKAGLGGKNIMSEINNILKEFAQSPKVTTLAFDSGFTKDERAHIHRLALRLSLKSKSEGQGEDRRITIGKKIAKWDLVKELLRANCENEAYKLIIPSNFENMWTD